MVLIGKITNNTNTCLLFKIRPETRDQSLPIDPNNVFFLAPLHILTPDTQKLKVQIIGNPTTRINSSIYVTVALFPVQHTLLDIAMGIVEDPAIINENFNDIAYADFINIKYTSAINQTAQIIYANKTGIVNSITTKIKDINYTFANNTINTLPTPGGFILTDEEATPGMSGSILILENNIIGIITAASQPPTSDEQKKGGNCGCDSSNASRAMAVDTYYILPHITQCVEAIDKYTYNNPENLIRLCQYTTMITFTDDLTPVVNHLGADYIFNQIENGNLEKHITLLNLHNYLEVASLRFLQENYSNTIEVKTTLNTNPQFIDYYFNKQQNSSVIFKSANYFDKITKQRIDIDFVQNSIFANILDWTFRGDPLQPLILNLQTKTVNNDGSVTLSTPIPFRFNSSKTTDIVFNKNESRTNLQIPNFFFYKNNARQIINSSFRMSNTITLLNMKTESIRGGRNCAIPIEQIPPGAEGFYCDSGIIILPKNKLNYF
jgi:hypothetical protein